MAEKAWMKYVTIWDSETQQKQQIPASELSPAMIQIRLGDDGPLVWTDPNKLKIGGKEVHPPFPRETREIFKQLSEALGEVFPQSVEQWEDGFRRDAHPEREISIWKRISFQYQRLVRSGTHTLARKMDCYRLCLNWSNTKSKELVLETTALNEVTREEASQLLDSLKVFPMEFFGGDFAKLMPGAPVLDYSAITALDEFKEIVAGVPLILAVDWVSGKTSFVYGYAALKSTPSSEMSAANCVIFAIDFESNQVEHLIAAVTQVNGWAEWNGEEIHPE